MTILLDLTSSFFIQVPASYWLGLGIARFLGPRSYRLTRLSPHRQLHGLPLIFLIVLIVLTGFTPIDITVSGRGIVRLSGDRIRVVSEIGGRIHRVHVQEGSEVQAGSALLQLDSDDILEKKKSLEARIHLAELRAAELDSLSATLLRARLSELYQDLEQTRLELERLTITSPADGQIISLVPLQANEILPARTTVAEVMPYQSVVIETSVPSSNHSDIVPGQYVRIQAHSFPPDQYNVLKGTILSVRPAGETYTVVVAPMPHSPKLLIGSIVEVQFTSKKEPLIRFLLDKMRA